jgi:tetratricopeptide (TPR) repeat protein/DNA-binding CsgD family transcriptional regulator
LFYSRENCIPAIDTFKVILLFLAGLFLIRCSSPTATKNDQAFDSLVRVVNLKLKTNADSALQASEMLYRLTTEKQDTAQAYEAARLRGQAFQVAGRNDSAYRYYSKMRKMAFMMNDTVRILQTCHILGTLLFEMGSNDSVAFWYRKGLTLAKASKNEAYLAGFSTNLGLVHGQNGQLDSAMQCYTEAARYYENLTDSMNIAQVYRNMGSLFIDQGLYQKAIQTFHLAIRINRKLDNMIEVATDYTNIAVAFMMISSDSAGYYYKAALKIISKKGTLANLLPLKFNYANYLSKLGRYDEAEQTYGEVLRISKANNILKGQIYSLNNLATTAVRHKDAPKANRLFEEALQLAGKNKLTADLLMLYREAFQSNLELQDVERAQTYFKRWDHLNDSLKTIEQRDAVLKYQGLYETQVLETKVNDLNSHVRLQKSRNIIIALILLALLLLVSTLVILLFFRNRQINQKRKLAEQQALHSEQEKLLKQAELDKKTLEHQLKEEEVDRLELEVNLREQDLVYQSLITTEMNHVNRSVQEKLGQFQYRFPKKVDQDEFSQLLSEIMRDASKSPMNDFEVMFKQMHGGFSEKLLAISPDFSRSELQICALLRLNLSSKDIARIANLSLATIEVTRHHIRKKLGLDQKESLSSYLIQL